MTPRIFVSSTYYDLKHVRERIELFLNNYGFEAVLFESDKVTYEFDKEIDLSAYQEVNLCHVMILIVGGRYGSMALVENSNEEQRRYEDYYVSITRKEYETATSRNIPVLIFVEKNVFSEYLTYSENKAFFDNIEDRKSQSKLQFRFAHVDHINIFKFIDFFRNKPIKTFDRVEEIETYIKLQFSGMFYLYLESLKQKSETNKILDTVGELNNVALRMNEMLTSVGKKILGNSKEEYEKVISSQYVILLDFFVEKLSSSLEFIEELDKDSFSEIDFDDLAEFFYKSVLEKKLSPPAYKKNIKWQEYVTKRKEYELSLVEDLNKMLTSFATSLQIKSLAVIAINAHFKTKVEPFIKSDNDKTLLLKKVSNLLQVKLSDNLPF